VGILPVKDEQAEIMRKKAAAASQRRREEEARMAAAVFAPSDNVRQRLQELERAMLEKAVLQKPKPAVEELINDSCPDPETEDGAEKLKKCAVVTPSDSSGPDSKYEPSVADGERRHDNDGGRRLYDPDSGLLVRVLHNLHTEVKKSTNTVSARQAEAWARDAAVNAKLMREKGERQAERERLKTERHERRMKYKSKRGPRTRGVLFVLDPQTGQVIVVCHAVHSEY
jgi:hypothetical protein